MPDSKILEDKVAELERRLEEIEKRLVPQKDPLFADAKRLVIKHGKTSVFFLQKNLLIDLDRATRLLDGLKADGIVKS